MKFTSARIEHAVEVLALAMSGIPTDPRAEGAFIVALHAVLIHEKHYEGRTHDDDTNEKFEALKAAAVKCADGIADTWDGVTFAWEPRAERFLRHVESIYTYRVAAST